MPKKTSKNDSVVVSDTANRRGQLVEIVRAALDNYLRPGEEIVGIKIGRVEGSDVFGFVKLKTKKRESSLFDFKASVSPSGSISYFQVNDTRMRPGID